MNFRPTVIKTLQAVIIGLISAFYFRDNCIGCSGSTLTYQLIIGFVPAFLWIYGFVSLFQHYENHSRFWYYLIVVPFVIIIPFILGIFLQSFFKLYY